MAFQYSCFISYRSGQYDFTKRFIEDLYGALSGELETQIRQPVYLDKERLSPGYLYNEELAQALCNSLCMIMVYTPQYFDVEATYCAREYAAMKDLEQQRFKAAGVDLGATKGLIIPIIFRGKKFLPAEVSDRRQYSRDFQDFMLSSRRIGHHPKYATVVKELAEYVKDLSVDLNGLRSPTEECKGYSLPSDEDIKDWLDTMVTPGVGFVKS